MISNFVKVEVVFSQFFSGPPFVFYELQQFLFVSLSPSLSLSLDIYLGMRKCGDLEIEREIALGTRLD